MGTTSLRWGLFALFPTSLSGGSSTGDSDGVFAASSASTTKVSDNFEDVDDELPDSLFLPDDLKHHGFPIHFQHFPIH